MAEVSKKTAEPLKVVLVIAIAAIFAGSIWFMIHAKNNSNSIYDNSTNALTGQKPNKKPKVDTSTAQSPAPKKSISSSDPAGFITASQSRKLTDFTPWQDSPAESVVKDFTGDGVDDMFVWAKLPGTMGYSIAAVWTLDSNNKPKELWYVPTAQVYAQSSWSVDGTNIIEKGKLDTPGGITDETNVYHWQTNTFVTY